MTNASALTALQSLNATNKALDTVQSRISTGYRVATASDNAAYWSIATTMRSDNSAYSAVQDSLGLGGGKVDTAYIGINDIRDAVDKMKQKLVTAQGASLENQQKIATEIEALQDHIKSVATNATYAGTNLLRGSTGATDLNIVSSYDRVGTTVTVSTITIARADTEVLDAAGTTGIVAAVTAATFFAPAGTALTDAQIDTALEAVETALSALANGAAIIGAAKSRIDLQKDFVSKLSDSIERGVGQLVDADMNKESTRLQALQVQQQLGIQSLSIANGNSQSILALFQN
jgi:flagellin